MRIVILSNQFKAKIYLFYLKSKLKNKNILDNSETLIVVFKTPATHSICTISVGCCLMLVPNHSMTCV